MKTIRVLFAALALAGFTLSAAAQDYPTKPIRLVVPFAAGGPADMQARWLGQRLGVVLGQPVVIENKGGAGGMVGTQAVVTAPADGHTLLFSSVGAIAIAPYIAEKALYDPKADLTPVVRVATAPMVLVTAGAGKFPTVASLIAHAKANPGKTSFASAGPGTTTQLGSELLKREAGIFIVHIPYRGAAPALTDVIAGTVDVMFADAPVVLPFLRGGRLKALAIGTPGRAPALPDVPTTGEQGYKNVLASTWYGMMAPAKTPAAVIAKVNTAVNNVLSSAEGKAFFAEQSMQVNGGTPEEFGTFIAAESKQWTALAKSAGVRLD